jgi:hypothetical protein
MSVVTSFKEKTDMSTLWEMAATIREDAPVLTRREGDVESRRKHAAIVDLNAPGRLDYWCRLLGTTPLRLYCAIDEVGPDPTAIRRFLTRPRAARTQLVPRIA